MYVAYVFLVKPNYSRLMNCFYKQAFPIYFLYSIPRLYLIEIRVISQVIGLKNHVSIFKKNQIGYFILKSTPV